MKSVKMTFVYVYKNLIEKCKQTRQPFSDDEFPPNQSSLGVYSSSLEWKRASAIVIGLDFYRGSIKPYNFYQPKLTNSYFLASFAALCQ